MWEYIIGLVVIVVLMAIAVSFTNRDESILSNRVILIVVLLFVVVVVGVSSNYGTVCAVWTLVGMITLSLLILGLTPVLAIKKDI